VLGVKTRQRVVGGSIFGIDGPAQVKQAGLHGWLMPNEPSYAARAADMLIFDLPPGKYNLATIETTRQVYNHGTWHEEYKIPAESVENYVFSVKLGEPKYLGVVTVEETQKLKGSVDFGLKPAGKEAEIAAWEKFISLYSRSSWANSVQKRISELKQ
jgi:hypothetical protein